MTRRSCHYSSFWLCTHATLGVIQDPAFVATSAIVYAMTTCGSSKKSQSELVADNDRRRMAATGEFPLTSRPTWPTSGLLLPRISRLVTALTGDDQLYALIVLQRIGPPPSRAGQRCRHPDWCCRG